MPKKEVGRRGNEVKKKEERVKMGRRRVCVVTRVPSVLLEHIVPWFTRFYLLNLFPNFG
jgi:hypothetical protein